MKTAKWIVAALKIRGSRDVAGFTEPDDLP